MEEKRKYMRFNASLEAKSRAAGWFRPRIRYLVKDVSREGFKVNTRDTLLKEGDLLELEMSLPGKKSTIEASGQVVWNNKLGDSGYNIGLRFKSIKPEDKFDILNFAYDNWVRSRRAV